MVNRFSFRDRVIPSPAKRVTSKNPPYRQTAAFERSKPADRFRGIRRTSRIETAASGTPRRDKTLIESDQIQQAGCDHRRSASIRANGNRRTDGVIMWCMLVCQFLHRVSRLTLRQPALIDNRLPLLTGGGPFLQSIRPVPVLPCAANGSSQ